MNININVLILFLGGLIYAMFFLLSGIVINKFSTLDEIYVRNNRRLATLVSLINHSFDGSLEVLRTVKDLKQNLILDDINKTLRSMKVTKIESREIGKLKAHSRIRRKEAATSLGITGGNEARLALERALGQEKDFSVKIYISNALTDIGDARSLDGMIEELIGTHKWYRDRAISNILAFGETIHPHFIHMKSTRDLEWMELLIKYAGEHFNDDTKAYLFYFVDNFEKILEEAAEYYEIKHKKQETRYKLAYLKKDMNDLLTLACRTLSNYYYLEFDREVYWTNGNSVIRNNAFWALSKKNSTINFRILLDHLYESPYEKTLIHALTKMLELNPKFIYLVEEAFESETDEIVKSRLAQILSNRIEYYILQLISRKSNHAKAILVQIIKNKRINEMIGFLNLNKDKDLNHSLIRIIKEEVAPDSPMGIELRTYLKEEALKEWGVARYSEERISKSHVKDRKLIRAVGLITIFGFLTIPLVFIGRYWNVMGVLPFLPILKRYVIEFNYGLAYYSILISMTYLALMALSYRNVRKQARLWNLKNISMLFRNKMIPSISIIAPAHNEEMTIVSSVKSLLNLKYPDYELIVVNDGSGDGTLTKLIEAFHLIRVNYQYTPSLDTAPIRGIYRNSSLPKLVVLDKSNGGKADALNAGINVANKEYFCGIDSDSLLEPEALLRLASLTLDESSETPALGGNIFPINGCEVDNGMITKIRIPKSHLARFQNIEYLRSFMIGRLGWQELNSLLIISGAFGLFRKERIIGIGGYLTSSGRYHKDTVGEDMELVVRICRLMFEIKQKFKILYAYNANCWTQVPEDMKSLKTQRYRWQRGLIDILFFHKKMILNPNYKMIGMVALPYFLVFEAIGPMIEIQGYLMIVLAAILNILDERIALLLFIATVLFGIINSLSALLIAEREEQYFSLQDMMKLLGYAIVENFGPRQWFSFWRIRGQLNMIFTKGGWGRIKRKGIG